MTNNKDFLSTSELAELLGVSRVAVFKKVKSGEIKAEKVGRNYVIPISEYHNIIGDFVNEEKKKEIDSVVERAVEEYGETFKKLGAE